MVLSDVQTETATSNKCKDNLIVTLRNQKHYPYCKKTRNRTKLSHQIQTQTGVQVTGFLLVFICYKQKKKANTLPAETEAS